MLVAVQCVLGCGGQEKAKVDHLEEAFFSEYTWKTAADVPQLIQQLSDNNETSRAEATYFLSQIGADASPAVAALTRSLGDRSSTVVAGAVYALGKIGPAAESALPALTKIAESPDQTVATLATKTIQQIQQNSREQEKQQ